MRPRLNRFVKTFSCAAILSILVAFIVIGLIPPRQVKAQSTSTDILSDWGFSSSSLSRSDFKLRWVNALDIEVSSTHNATTKIDFVASVSERSGGGDSKAVFHPSGGRTCDASLTLYNITSASDSNSKGKNPELDIKFKTSPAASSCDKTSPSPISVMFPIATQNALAYFAFTDDSKNNIIRVDHDSSWKFSKANSTANPNGVYLRDSEKGQDCTDKIIFSDPSTAYFFELDKGADASVSDKSIRAFQGNIEAPGCKYYTPGSANRVPSDLPMRILAANDPGATNPAAATTANGGANSSSDNSCESKGGALGWIMCPVIRALDDALHWVDSAIQGLLQVDNKSFNNPDIKNAWAVIRNIAYIILVPIMLVMVIGTAIGSNLVDAYTVKKALPRMVGAVIFISLSYYICVFFIDLFNVIGSGTKGLLTSAFGHGVGALTLSSLYGTGTGTTLFQAITAIPLAIGALFVLWLFFGTILLFAGLAFLVLLLRQIFIVALLLVAPLAILAWIFPGNDKVWKDWWSAFSKLLIMFPLIMALVSVGRIFAFIINSGDHAGIQGPILIPIMKLAAYMLPYAFIPFTFKFAGGLFATVAGMANDKSKGLFDRQKQSRADKLQRTAERRMFKNAPAGGLRSKMNTLGAGAMNARQAGLDPRRMRTKMRTALNDSADSRVAKFAQENASFNAWSGDDAKVAAARYDSHDDIANELSRFDRGRFAGEANRARREEAVAQIMRTKREVDNGTFQRARVRAQAKTGTGYQDPVTGEFNAAAMLEDINSVYGNDRNGAGKALAEMRSSLAQSGQIAGVAGFGTWAEQLDSLNSGTVTAQAAHNAIMDDAINSASPGQAIYGKPSSAAAMGQAHARRIQTIADSMNTGSEIVPTGQRDAAGNNIMRAATMDDLSAAVAGAAGIYDAMSQASPGNASAMANELMGQDSGLPEIRITDPITGVSSVIMQPSSIRELIQTQMGGNAEFVNRRRDISQSTLERAAAYQRQQGIVPGADNRPVNPVDITPL